MTVAEALKVTVSAQFYDGVIRQAKGEYYDSVQNYGHTADNDIRLVERVSKAQAASEADDVTLIGPANDFGIRPKKTLNPIWDAAKVAELVAAGYEYTSRPTTKAVSLDEQFWKLDA